MISIEMRDQIMESSMLQSSTRALLRQVALKELKKAESVMHAKSLEKQNSDILS